MGAEGPGIRGSMVAAELDSFPPPHLPNRTRGLTPEKHPRSASRDGQARAPDARDRVGSDRLEGVAQEHQASRVGLTCAYPAETPGFEPGRELNTP